MSESRIPAPNNRYKPLDIPLPLLDENLPIREVYGVLRVDGSWQPLPLPAKAPKPPVKPKRRREPEADTETTSPIAHTLYSLQTFGFTHPSQGNFLMIPKEFEAILLLETKAVAAVVWEIAQQTIGWADGREPGSRREWAPLTKRHFERAKKLSGAQAQRGITRALDRGYIERQKLGARRYEYRLRWKGSN